MGTTAPKRMRFSQALYILALLLCLFADVAGAQDGRQGPLANTVSAVSLGAPAKARDHLERARRASLKGDEDEYQRELAATLTIYPHYAEAYLLRASHELLLDHPYAAIDAALTARRLEPSIRWATIIHAIACNQLKQFTEATALLDGLGEGESGTWQAIFEKARAAVGTGDIEAALHWSERALTTVPPNRVDDSVLLRGDALLMAHRWPEAVAEFQTYLRSPRPQAHRGEVLALLGRITELASQEPAELIAANPQ